MIVTQVKRDNREITKEQWIKYENELSKWKKKYKDRMNSMEAYMMKPNEPNYFKANND